MLIDVNRYIEKTFDKPIEVPCYEKITKEVPVYKDKIIEVPIVTETQNLVFQEKVKEVEKNFDVILEKKFKLIKSPRTRHKSLPRAKLECLIYN